MQLKVINIITDAMGLIGASAINEAPTSADIQVGIRSFNMMIDRWSADRRLLRSTSTVTIPVVAGKVQYTIGTSTSDITSAKPIRVISAFLRDNNSIDHQIEIVPQAAYDALQDKTYSQSMPTTIYYDPGVTQQVTQKGTLFIYPVPDSAMTYTLYLECDLYLQEVTSANEAITFDPAYYEALVYGLAVRLWRRYHAADKPIPNDIVVMATTAMNTVGNMNTTQVRSAMDIPGKVATFNVYTGDYN